MKFGFCQLRLILDWCSISWIRFLKTFDFYSIGIRLVKNHRDRKKKVLEHVFFTFVSFSLDWSTSNFFFVLIWVKYSKVLFLNNRYDLFAPYFCIFYIHACIFINFSQKFQTLGILGFLMFEFVLINFDQWVFVHASYKHCVYALIWKFSCFVKLLRVRVHKLFEFGDFVQLGLICSNWLMILFDWSIRTCFYNCGDIQFINMCVFEKLGFLLKNWFYESIGGLKV